VEYLSPSRAQSVHSLRCCSLVPRDLTTVAFY
jgi:hypothetical protein